MTRYKHPRALGREDPPQFAVDLNGERVVLDSAGCFETDRDRAVEQLAAAYDVDVSELRVEATYRCGVNDCSREVDSPDATCWQHDD